MIIVADATPLIHLASVGQFDLLRALFQEIVITPQVFDEVVTRGGDRPGAQETRTAKFVVIRAPTDPGASTRFEVEHGLGPGESSSIALALETKAELILMDDREARAVATGAGLKTAGTIRVLEMAVERSLLTDLASVYEKLAKTSARIAPDIIAASLKRMQQPRSG